MIDPKNHPYLPVCQGNSLVSTGGESRQRKGMDNDDDYYDEINQAGEIVAKYYVWHHMSIYPPQKVNEGWQKFDIQGNVIASGSKNNS
jgi:hypothetical protein